MRFPPEVPLSEESCCFFRHTDVSLFCLSVSVCLCCVFQHALRLLAFGQLYKVLNMDPLPASKPSSRLLEGVCSVMRA